MTADWAYLDHLVVFAVAFVTVLALTPVVRRLAQLVGAVAQPGERHIHTRPTATLGGLALLAGVLAAIGVGSFLPAFEEVFRATSEPEAVVLASLIVVAAGVLDDTRGLSAPAKLAAQIVAAGTLVLFGVRLLFVYVPGNPGSIVSLGPDLGALITIVAIVAMINAVNLVDGLDGLAAGIVAIAAGALFAYVQMSEATPLEMASSASLLLPALAGVCLGFLVHNFNPASIFMGDTGAMLLGLMLAAAGVSAVGAAISPGRGDFAALSVPVLVPGLVLAVPFIDTAWTVLRRLRGGRALFSPDKEHIHHRLLQIGHSHRRAVLIMYYWSALLAFAAVGVGLLPPLAVAAVVGVGVGGAGCFTLASRLARRRGRHACAARRTVAGARGLPGGPRRARAARPSNFVLAFTKSSGRPAKTPSDQRKRGRGQL